MTQPNIDPQVSPGLAAEILGSHWARVLGAARAHKFLLAAALVAQNLAHKEARNG